MINPGGIPSNSSPEAIQPGRHSTKPVKPPGGINPETYPHAPAQAREKPTQARRHTRVIWLPDPMPGGILSGFLPIKGKKSKKAHVFRHCTFFVLLPGYPIDINEKIDYDVFDINKNIDVTRTYVFTSKPIRQAAFPPPIGGKPQEQTFNYDMRVRRDVPKAIRR